MSDLKKDLLQSQTRLADAGHALRECRVKLDTMAMNLPSGEDPKHADTLREESDELTKLIGRVDRVINRLRKMPADATEVPEPAKKAK